MKNIIVAGIVGLATASLWAAEPKEQVTNAAKELAGKANYSWVQTVKMAVESQFTPGPTTGKINKEGLAYVTSSFGQDMTMESAMKGDKIAFKGQDGWQAVAAPAAGAAAGGGRGMGMRGGGMMRNFKSPAAQVEDLVSKAKELKLADGVISGDLTEDGAKSLMAMGGRGGRGGGAGGAAPEIAGAKASVKFWIKDGVLTKFETTTQGKMTFGDQERDMGRTTTVEIKDVGTTKLELPAEAVNLLK